MDFQKHKGTCCLCSIIVVLYLLGLVLTPSDDRDPFSLSASNIILNHIRPWVYLTSGYYQPYLLQTICMVLCIFGFGRQVEEEIGTVAFFKLILFANLASTICIFLELILGYILFRWPAILTTNVSSFSGGVGAMLIGLALKHPEERIGCIRKRHLPGTFVVLCWGSTLAGCFVSMELAIEFLPTALYALSGTYFGWYYLRFLHPGSDSVDGNQHENFAFVRFFPDICSSCLGPFSNFTFGVIKLCGWFQNRTSNEFELPVSVPHEKAKSPGSFAVSERRKARAKKALQEKLAQLASAPASPRSSVV